MLCLLRNPRWVQSHAQVPEASEREDRTPGGLRVQELQFREALQRLADGDLPLESRERTAKAHMSICAERQMPVVLAVNVEAIGIRDMPRVAVRRRDHEKNGRACRDPNALEVDVLSSAACICLDRTFVAQHLLECCTDGKIAPSHVCKRLGMPQERVDAIADEVPRSLVSRSQEEHA